MIGRHRLIGMGEKEDLVGHVNDREYLNITLINYLYLICVLKIRLFLIVLIYILFAFEG